MSFSKAITYLLYTSKGILVRSTHLDHIDAKLDICNFATRRSYKLTLHETSKSNNRVLVKYFEGKPISLTSYDIKRFSSSLFVTRANK